MGNLSPRERVRLSLRHEEPDRVPTDFLATPEVWNKLIARLQPDTSGITPGEFIEPAREAILRHFEIDCRVLSYDMFCQPPEAARASPAGYERHHAGRVHRTGARGHPAAF